MIRVLLFDRHELIRIGLKTVLRQADDIEVVADLGDFIQVESLMRSEQPDLLLIDASEGETSLEHLRHLYSTGSQAKVIVLTTTFDPDCLLATLRGESAGYLLKSARPTELTAAVRAVAHGGVYIHASLIEHLPKQMLQKKPLDQNNHGLSYDLSSQELSVMTRLVKGYTNRETSQELYLSPKTVETYRARIYTKLGVSSRSELFTCALEQGLVAF